jgi:hypothetical protein
MLTYNLVISVDDLDVRSRDHFSLDYCTLADRYLS